MIVGIEIALFLVGLFALVTGRLPLGPRIVRGAPARMLGILAMMPC